MSDRPANGQPWQFSLGSLLIAVVFVALACAAGKFVVSMDHHATPLVEISGILSLFGIPIALCGAVGVLRGHLKAWLAYGAMIDLVLVVTGLLLPAVNY